MRLSAGDRVDRYEVVAFLGSGGMGEVYRARDPKLQRQIALKILRTDGPLATEGRQRLLREARAVAALSHPNVLAVFDVGEVAEPEHLRGIAYIAMELVVGSPLRAHFRSATISLERRLQWLVDIAGALAAAHEAGLVHRDVKPENVMVRFDGAVKVLDFGIARSVGPVDALSSTEGHSLPTLHTKSPAPGASTQTHVSAASPPGSVAGTLFYMAPEQLRGESIDGRADQFAWGVVAYELLTGVPPWSLGPDPIAIVSQILSHTPRPPAAIEPAISAGVSNAIMRTLAKDRSERFSSMRDLLGGVASNAASGVAAHEAPPAATAVTQSARTPLAPPRRVLRYIGASMLLATIVAAVISWSRRHDVASSSAASVSGTPFTVGCTSRAACAREHGGGAWRCQSVRHECVEIGSVDCKVVAEPTDFTNDETVWIGALYPTSGPLSEARAFELARQDFATALGGSVGGATGVRPIGEVLCDELVDPVRATKHLVADVETPAVVGFYGREDSTLIASILLPAHVASFIAINSASDLTRIPEAPTEPRLIWRTTLDEKDIAAPLAALVSEIEHRTHAPTAPTPKDAFRVALLRRGASDVSAEIFRDLHFNGKSALENGDDFRQYAMSTSADAGVDETVEALLAFRPRVIFLTQAFVPGGLELLERRWGAGVRPVYLITSASFENDIPAFAGRDPDRRRRFFGVTNMSTRMPNAQLVLRYNQAFPTDPITRTEAPQPSYDAFYILAYSILAQGDATITGPSISRALDRLLPPGRPVDVGPQGIFDALSALRAGENVDLSGALSDLDFVRATGEAPIDYAIVCLGVDDHGAAKGSVDSGLVYDAKLKKLMGTIHCP